MAEERRVRRATGAAALLDKARQLRAQASQQQYDVQAWEALVDDVKAMPGISDDLRAAFEEIVAVMPSACVGSLCGAGAQGGAWAGDSEADLWPLPTGLPLPRPTPTIPARSNEPRGPQGLPEVRSAYEFSLDTLGQDLAAGALWQEYISFLLSSKPGSEAFKALYAGAMEGQEEAARTPMVRRAYQRAVVVPSLQLEALWRAYESWEMRTDKQLGKKVWAVADLQLGCVAAQADCYE
ncbi:Suf domain-containing protein, partial [Haematococcus lacustris]